MSSTDKAALLAAINQSVNAPKQQSKADAYKVAQRLNTEQGVNSRVAHDLVSNASRPANMADVQANPAGFDHKATLDKDKLSRMGGNDASQDNELRSIKSEFDYNSKKKFTDVLGEPSKAAQLARLQQEFKAPGAGDLSKKSSYKSRISQRTQNSRAPAVIEKMVQDAQQESPAYSNKLIEELIGTL